MTLTADLCNQALYVAAVVDPDVMTGAQAAAAVEDLATADKAVGSTLLFLALRVATSDAWRGQGFASAADWLADKAGISVAEAARQLATAKKADQLPKTKDAMKKGGLSPDQAGAVADGATADPDAEDDLLDSAAKDTNKALKDKAAKAKAAATDSKTRERRIRARRSLRRGTDADGAFWVRVYGPGADAAGFESMLRPFEELMFRHGRTDGVRDSFENRSYDAFHAMLAYLNGASTSTGPAPTPPSPAPPSPPAPAPPTPPTSGQPSPDDATGSGAAPDPSTAPAPAPAPEDDTGAAQPSADPPTTAGPPAETDPPANTTTWSPPWDPERVIPLPARMPGGNNVKVIVTVSHTALLRGYTVAGETSEIAGVGPISVQAVRDILRQDPFLAVVVTKGRDVVNVAHHGRGLNAHQRTAIEATGLRCSNLHCNRTIAIQIDHRTPYAQDPITALGNQDPLCPNCHRLKTHHGHHLEDGTGPRRLLPPNSPTPPDSPHQHSDPSARPRVEQPVLC